MTFYIILALYNSFDISSIIEVIAPHSSALAWKTPWTEEPGGLQSMGLQKSGMTERLHFHFSLSCIGEGNGNPRQCSSLENPRDGGDWWAAIYGVAQSRTRLKRLTSIIEAKYWNRIACWSYTGHCEIGKMIAFHCFLLKL